MSEYVLVPMEDLEALQSAVVMGKPGYAAARRLAGHVIGVRFYASLRQIDGSEHSLWLSPASGRQEASAADKPDGQ